MSVASSVSTQHDFVESAESARARLNRNEQKRRNKAKNVQSKAMQLFQDASDLQRNLLETSNRHSATVIQLESQLANIISTSEARLYEVHNRHTLKVVDMQTQIDNLDKIMSSLHTDAHERHNTFLNMQEQLAMAVQAAADNSVLNVSRRHKSLERRYEIIQGLYVSAESSYHTAVTHESIGETLRTMLELYTTDVGSRLIRFHGDDISLAQRLKNERLRKGKGEYTLSLGKKRYLDCFEAQLSGECRAYKSNSARHLVLKGSRKKAKANCKLICHSGECWLVLTRPIPAGGELLWSYGSGFKLNGRAEDSDEEFDDDSVSADDEDAEPEVEPKEPTVTRKRKNHHWSRK